MKHLFGCLILIFTSIAWAQDDQADNWSKASPLLVEQLQEDPRLIEPTSPILGKNLVAKIRADERHPQIIYQSIITNYPEIRNDLHISSIGYFTTLLAPLKHYCSNEFSENELPKDLTQVEHAAIPVSVLLPLHQNYLLNMGALKITPFKDLESMAFVTATEYQNQRYDCAPVKKLERMENKFKKFFPKRYDRLVDINHDISSPEAAYPRVQFSINGLTQYVFRELMALEIEKLSKLLSVVYDSQLEWLELKSNNPKLKTRLFSHIEKRALQDGFLPREILLAISYSTRNMPSLDVHYGYDAEKALLLEVYFWKFHPIKKLVANKYVADTYPNKKMKKNPGLYHYATAALLACDIKLHGYSGISARLLALASKAGYKFHKLMTEATRKKIGISGLIKLAKRQGFGPGILAGRYGGAHGLSFCRKHTPKEFWLKNLKTKSEELNSVIVQDEELETSQEFELEDFTPEMEAQL